MTMTLGFALSAARAAAKRLSIPHTTATQMTRAHLFGFEYRVIFIGFDGGASLAVLPDPFSLISRITDYVKGLMVLPCCRASWGHGAQTASAVFGSELSCDESRGSQGGHFRRRKRMRWTEQYSASRRKGDPGKVRLASELRAKTTMPLTWIAQRLNMGSRVRFAHDASGSRRAGALRGKAFRMLLAPGSQLSATKGGGSASSVLGLIGVLIDPCLHPSIVDFGG